MAERPLNALLALTKEYTDPPEGPPVPATVPPMDFALVALLSARLNFEHAISFSRKAKDHRQGAVHPLHLRPPSYGPGNKTKSKAAPKKWDPATDFDKWSYWSWWVPPGDQAEKRLVPRDALFLPALQLMEALVQIKNYIGHIPGVFATQNHMFPSQRAVGLSHAAYALACETVGGTPDTTLIAIQLHSAIATWLPGWLASAAVRNLDVQHVHDPLKVLDAVYHAQLVTAREGYSRALEKAGWRELGASYLKSSILSEMVTSYSNYTPTTHKLLIGLGYPQEEILAHAVKEALDSPGVQQYAYNAWLEAALYYSNGPLLDAMLGHYSTRKAFAVHKIISCVLYTPHRDPPAPPGRGREEALLRYLPVLCASELRAAVNAPHCCRYGHKCTNLIPHGEWTPNPRLYTEAVRLLRAIPGIEPGPLRPNILSPEMLVFFLRLGLDLDLDPRSFPDLLHLYDNAREGGLIGGSGFPDDPDGILEKISRWTGDTYRYSVPSPL